MVGRHLTVGGIGLSVIDPSFVRFPELVRRSVFGARCRRRDQETAVSGTPIGTAYNAPSDGGAPAG